jgi:hypothetical protein
MHAAFVRVYRITHVQNDLRQACAMLSAMHSIQNAAWGTGSRLQ